MSPQEGAVQTADEVAQSKAMRWSMGLLFAAGVSVMVGFLATQLLTGRSMERLGPSSDAVARERVPSSEKVRIEQPGTYDVFYEQAAPSTGVPGSLDVTVRSDRGELGLDTPDPVLSTIIDDRSYVAFHTVRIPRAGTYTLDVAVKGGEPAGSLFEDDRVVLDRANREADALWMLLGLAPAAAGLVLAACFGVASVWVRARSARAGRADGRGPSGGSAFAGRWGPPTDHAFRDPPPPPEFPRAGPPAGPDAGDQPPTEGEPPVADDRA
ncbi:MAG: hypothetical protein IPH81_14465 [Candidatus Microthrix sp.]|nr:hypothetical protein [Candidatus Microthrix sp.]